MRIEGEKEPDLIGAAEVQDLDAPDPHKPSRASTAALKAGMAGFGLVLLSMLLLPRQDAVRWSLYTAVGVIAAWLLSPPGNIIRSIKTGTVAGLIAAGLAFAVWFALVFTVAKPFLEGFAREVYGGWSGVYSELAWTAAWNVLAAVALGALGSGIVGTLGLGRRHSRLFKSTRGRH